GPRGLGAPRRTDAAAAVAGPDRGPDARVGGARRRRAAPAGVAAGHAVPGVPGVARLRLHRRWAGGPARRAGPGVVRLLPDNGRRRRPAAPLPRTAGARRPMAPAGGVPRGAAA